MAEEKKKKKNEMLLAFFGDSDIARWPAELLLPDAVSEDDMHLLIIDGVNGAKLSRVVNRAREFIGTKSDALDSISRLVVVACAGENDICSGKSVDKTMEAFNGLLDVFFVELLRKQRDNSASSSKVHLIFLGPKFEPWLKEEEDPNTRQKYVELSNAMKRACHEHPSKENICYVDCLTMFCGESANVPGAISGGRAIAVPKFFADDGLHLSHDGYKVWRDVIGDCFDSMMMNVKGKEQVPKLSQCGQK